MRSRLFHLFLEGAHALGVDPAFHRSTGDESAEADAAQDQSFEGEFREGLAHSRASGLETFRKLGLGRQALPCGEPPGRDLRTQHLLDAEIQRGGRDSHFAVDV